MVRSDLQSLRALLGGYLLPYWKQIVLLVGVSFIAAMLGSVYPLLLAPVMNVGLLSNPSPAATLAEVNLNNLGATILKWLAIDPGNNATSHIVLLSIVLFAICGIVAAAVEFGALMLAAWITTRAHADLQVAMHRRLGEQELQYFLHSRVGDLANRFITDAGETITSVDFAVRHALQSMLQILIYGWLLLKTSPLLATATLAVSLVHLGINRFVGARLRRTTTNMLESLGLVSGALQEEYTTIRVIKSFGADAFQHKRVSAVFRLVRRATLIVCLYKNGETPLRRITDISAIGLIMLLAFGAMSAGDMTFQGFVLFMVVVRLTIAPISAFAQAMTRMQAGLGAAHRVLQVLDRSPQLSDGARKDPTFEKQLRLEKVTFSYDAGKPVLKGIDLAINKGEVVAIVGPSGSGKSSVVDLILRLFDPESGRVTIDGVDVREFDQSTYRRLFGVVSQESLLFNDTIHNNIVFGRETGDSEDVRRACEIANANEFIDVMAKKHDAMVGDRGTRLSGGQRQRIAIARAIYAQPQILLLDEATSALDTESERVVQQAIDKVLANATAVVIAHRLSTVMHADRIVVLVDGAIEAIGRHEELLRTSRTYRALNEMQFSSGSRGHADRLTNAI